MYTYNLKKRIGKGIIMVFLSMVILIPTLMFNFSQRSLAANALPLDHPKVYAYLDTGYLLSESGDLFAWGDNESGQLGLGDKDENYDGNGGRNYLPQNVSAKCGIKFTEVFPGVATFALSEDGELYGWGKNSQGMLGKGYIEDRPSDYSPARIADFSPQLEGVHFKKVASGLFTTWALDENGDIWSWGGNEMGKLGIGEWDYYNGGLTPYVLNPQRIVEAYPALGSVKFKNIAGAYDYMVGVSTHNDIYFSGQPYLPSSLGNYPPGPTNTLANITPYNPELNGINIAEIYPAHEYMSALSENGELISMGSERTGQLGTGSTVNQIYNPIVNTFPSDAFVKLGTETGSLALSTSGELYTWGTNSEGFLGIGTDSNPSANATPAKITFANPSLRFVDVARSMRFNLAISTDGEIFSWGGNLYGGLGLGDIDTNNDGNGGRNYSPQYVGKIETPAVTGIQSYTTTATNTAEIGTTVPTTISGFVVSFDHEMLTNPAILTGNSIVLKAQGSDVNVLSPSGGLATASITTSWSADAKTLSVAIPQTLSSGTNYTLRVSGYRKADSFRDSIVAKTLTFTTEGSSNGGNSGNGGNGNGGNGNGGNSGNGGNGNNGGAGGNGNNNSGAGGNGNNGGAGGSGNNNGGAGGNGNNNGGAGIDAGNGGIDGNNQNNSDNDANNGNGDTNLIDNSGNSAGNTSDKNADKDLAGLNNADGGNSNSSLADSLSKIPVIGPVLAAIVNNPALSAAIGSVLAIGILSIIGMPVIGLVVAAILALVGGIASGHPILGALTSAVLLAAAAGMWWLFILGKRRKNKEEEQTI
jgi:alpha-tubulin suppressor-like RCC1 family protein